MIPMLLFAAYVIIAGLLWVTVMGGSRDQGDVLTCVFWLPCFTAVACGEVYLGARWVGRRLL